METISVYEGQDPFVFVSYAHKDSDAVYRILRLLQGRGLRIWYDEGITPGSEWPEYIASHLDRAEAVIVFITESSVNSFNCRREITFAQARNKSFISVFLEKTEVPLGMELQLSAQQSMFRYDYAGDEAFVDRLIRTPCLQPCIRPSREQERGEDPHTDRILFEPGSAEFFGTEEGKADSRGDPEDDGPGITAQPPDPAGHADGSTGTVDTERPPDLAPAEKRKRGKKKKPAAVLIAAVLVLLLAAGAFGYLQLGTGSRTYVDSGDPDSLGSLRGVRKSLTLKDKHMTDDMVRQVNKVRDLSYVSFTGCEFEEGALNELRMSAKEGNVTMRFYNCSGMEDCEALGEQGDIYELDIVSCDIKDQGFPDLSDVIVKNLTISGCPDITKLSLNTEKLYRIDLSGSGISDISFLDGAGLLRDISLARTKVTDLTPLVPLEKITRLDLSGIRMDSFDLELQSLGLEKIYLHDCGLTSAGSLGDYTKLVEVDLGGNQLSDVGFLSDIAANLTYLDLSGNLIKSEEELFFSQDADELYFLQDAVNMKVLLLDHIDLFNHQLSCVRNMKDLEKISARDCGLTDISDMAGCSSLDEILLGFNGISDLQPIADISGPENPIKALDLAANDIRDLSALQGNYMNLVLVGNPLEKYESSNPFKSSVLLIDYFEGLENSSMSLSGSNYGTPSICGCPRNKQEAVTDALYDPVFETREEQLTRIRQDMQYVSYDGFEEMFLAIPEP